MSEDRYLNKKLKLKKGLDIVFVVNSKYPSGQAGLLADEYGIKYSEDKMRLPVALIDLLFEEYIPEIKEEKTVREQLEEQRDNSSAKNEAKSKDKTAHRNKKSARKG